MVVFVDLDDDVPPDDPHADRGKLIPYSRLSIHSRGTKNLAEEYEDCDRSPAERCGEAGQERPNPNLNAVSAALGCYPIISQITQNIDLNTLHALSRTCRQIRSNILQYRTYLIQSTLHCEYESVNTTPHPARTPSIPKWHILGEAGHFVSGSENASTSTSSTTTCARDLVGDCRRCGRIICRNCTIKPPSASKLPSRLRRLCHTCLNAPIALLTTGPSSPGAPCSCPQSIHLCMPCGLKLATADTTYRRVWTWRTRYTTYLGGLGTGIGEGNEGVKCARGRDCLGAKEVEVEFECPYNNGSSSSSSTSSTSSASGSGSDISETTITTTASTASVTNPNPATADTLPVPGFFGFGPLRPTSTPSTPGLEDTHRDKDKDEAAGYWRQEIEGLGGVVKKKFRKRERVGRTVREWEDEREGSEEILGREKRGQMRSWCGWCGRVVLGAKDVD